MADSGLTPTGLVIETLDDILAGITADVQGRWGPSVDNSSATPNGQFSGSIAERLASVWQLAEAVYSSQDPDKATGQALDAVCKLTGTFRPPATASTVTETICGDPGTVVASGFTVATVSTQDPFASQLNVTLDALAAWATGTGYALGDRVTANARCYQCITAGTSAAAGSGPSTADPDITDNTVHWKWIGDGTAAGDVVLACTETGPVIATAGDLTDIKTPIGGVNTATNLSDAALGANAMSDQNLRLLREEELARPGSTTAPAIQAMLLQITGVVSATVFMNLGDTTDVDGLPPHSVECLVDGGADQDIVDALWNSGVAAGIQTHGTSSGTVVDSEGNTQTIYFSRFDQVAIAVDITLTKDATKYIGDSNVASIIATWGNGQAGGKDAVSSAVGAQAFGDPGTLDVTQTLLAIYPATPVSSATIVISSRQRTTWDSAHVTVHSSNGTP